MNSNFQEVSSRGDDRNRTENQASGGRSASRTAVSTDCPHFAPSGEHRASLAARHAIGVSQVSAEYWAGAVSRRRTGSARRGCSPPRRFQLGGEPVREPAFA